MSKPQLARYRTTNWLAYIVALKRRGSLMVWLDRERCTQRALWPACGLQRHA
jgi:hypothetical protein